MLKNFDQQINDELFRKYAEKIFVYLKSGVSKDSSFFDPDYDTPKTITKQNGKPVKAIVRTLTPESLIFRELGLIENGAIEITIHKRDINYIKLAEKITYKGNEYTVYNKGLGNRVQIYGTVAEFNKVILFRKR